MHRVLNHRKRLTVLTQLIEQVLAEDHDEPYVGYFSAKKMYEPIIVC